MEFSGSSNMSSNSGRIWPSGSNLLGPSLVNVQLLGTKIPKKMCPSYSLQILFWCWIQTTPGLPQLPHDFQRNFFIPTVFPGFQLPFGSSGRIMLFSTTGLSQLPDKNPNYLSLSQSQPPALLVLITSMITDI